MDLMLENKVVLITGGAKGIGNSIAREFLNEGAKVAIVDKDKNALYEFSKQVTDSSKLFCIEADLTNEIDCKKAYTQSKESLGSISVLVNNAGINDGLDLGNTQDDFIASLNRNLVHYYLLTSLVIEDIRQNQGSIVNIGSKVAVTGQGSTSGYAAAKGGILALTREWAAQFAKDGVRVNTVVPAEVLTPLYELWLTTFSDPESKLKEIERKIPLGGRLASAQEIADMVVFLASSRASYVTGQYIFVDGGYTHLDRSLTYDS